MGTGIEGYFSNVLSMLFKMVYISSTQIKNSIIIGSWVPTFLLFSDNHKIGRAITIIGT